MAMPSQTLRTVASLVTAGLVDASDQDRLDAVAGHYAVAITPDMAGLIEPDDRADPIARQFVPDVAELEQTPDEASDPIGDHVHEKVPGLIHRYPDRVLLKVTHACPVYCRFCFRREVVGPGGDAPLIGAALDKAVDYIAAAPAIWEVILTGGDPLILSPRRIAEITSRLSEIPHVQVLRWHTRVPVVDPSRVTGDIVAALRSPTKSVYVGVHANHPRELTEAAKAACRRLAAGGLSLVSQTVLLKGVNNDAETLAALFRTFVTMGVRPYYLHHADLAPGTARFRTTLAEGQSLMRALRGQISGLALPTYILDVPGGYGKIPVGPGYVDAATREIRDVSGRAHAYPPIDPTVAS